MILPLPTALPVAGSSFTNGGTWNGVGSAVITEYYRRGRTGEMRKDFLFAFVYYALCIIFVILVVEGYIK